MIKSGGCRAASASRFGDGKHEGQDPAGAERSRVRVAHRRHEARGIKSEGGRATHAIGNTQDKIRTGPCPRRVSATENVRDTVKSGGCHPRRASATGSMRDKIRRVPRSIHAAHRRHEARGIRSGGRRVAASVSRLSSTRGKIGKGTRRQSPTSLKTQLVNMSAIRLQGYPCQRWILAETQRRQQRQPPQDWEGTLEPRRS